MLFELGHIANKKKIYSFEVSNFIFCKGALAGPGLAGLLGSGGPATSSSTSRYIFWVLHAYSWRCAHTSFWFYLLSPFCTHSSRSQSAAATPSSGSAARISSTQAPTTPVTPAATSTSSPTVTPTTPAAQTPSMPAGPPSSTQPIQLSDLQSILATMNVPAMAAEGPGGETLTADVPLKWSLPRFPIL